MNAKIGFIPKNEATFICPKSSFEGFRDFLKKESIHILGYEGFDDYSHVYVEGVDKGESDQLIAKYNG
jgi:hypothetical protein